MDHPDATTDRLRSRVTSALDGDDWELSGDSSRLRIALSDRVILVSASDGPDGEPRWALSLVVAGKTVSKFGRYDSLDDVADQVSFLQTTDVRYTVCCDGTRD